jgi:hypothetical protein
MFSIKLDVLNDVEKQILSTSSIPDSSLNEVLMEICNQFSRYPDIIKLSISGFDKNWSNINIDSDLCMLMEDMPKLVKFIQNTDVQESQFGFPEQHIQRILTIVRISSGLKISCSDWLSENSEVKEELIKTEDFLNLLRILVQRIQLAVDKVCPVAHDNRFFKDWLQQVQLKQAP